MNRSKILFTFYCFFILSGCTSSKNYHFGLYTQKTFGQILTEESQKPEEIILLVLQYRSIFVETYKGYPEEALAKVIRIPNREEFNVPIPLDIHRQKIYFLAQNFKIDFIETSVSLGVGADERDVFLKYDPNWKNTFTFSVKPFLIDFINKYQKSLSGGDSDFLYRWMEKNEEKIYQDSIR